MIKNSSENTTKERKKREPKNLNQVKHSLKDNDLTLMEQVFLLGLNDEDGCVSFWNDNISMGLRGCILVELILRDRIEIESCGLRKKNLLSRTVIVKDATPVGDPLIDEALKLMKQTKPPESIQTWVMYLSGETWNVSKLCYQMRNVRERLAKNLVEKGILSTNKKNYLFFNMNTYPLKNKDVKERLTKGIINTVLKEWVSNHHLMDSRMLALIILAYVSEVLDNALKSLENDDYVQAYKRVENLAALKLQEECCRRNICVALWAIIATLK